MLVMLRVAIPDKGMNIDVHEKMEISLRVIIVVFWCTSAPSTGPSVQIRAHCTNIYDTVLGCKRKVKNK